MFTVFLLHVLFSFIIFMCSCYYLVVISIVVVTDEDECSLQTHNCSNRAVCSNTVGGYNCSCQNGYDGDGFSCTGNCCVFYTSPFLYMYYYFVY